MRNNSQAFPSTQSCCPTARKEGRGEASEAYDRHRKLLQLLQAPQFQSLSQQNYTNYSAVAARATVHAGEKTRRRAGFG